MEDIIIMADGVTTCLFLPDSPSYCADTGVARARITNRTSNCKQGRIMQRERKFQVKSKIGTLE